MEKHKTITATEFDRLRFSKFTLDLTIYPFIAVTYYGDAKDGIEIHPPGTGERLAELECLVSTPMLLHPCPIDEQAEAESITTWTDSDDALQA